MWEHNNLCNKGVFNELFSCNVDDRLSPSFHIFAILCIMWDTPSENTGLWQLPKVSIAFKSSLFCCHPFLSWFQIIDNTSIAFSFSLCPQQRLSSLIRPTSEWESIRAHNESPENIDGHLALTKIESNLTMNGNTKPGQAVWKLINGHKASRQWNK